MKDPAYPPNRQTIYLKVAQPRALVVLKGAGKIGAAVREFITTELEIRIEVPALELLSDATIAGGPLLGDAGTDVLAPHYPLGDTDPDIALGPDSVGTLSFTSGSTGIPKGVRGRHYSLTHFFPWMGKRFGLNENSKFTMLSGIAHDPIQRDSKCMRLGMQTSIIDLAFLFANALFHSIQCSRRYSSVHSCMYPPQTILVLPDVSPNGWPTLRLQSRT